MKTGIILLIQAFTMTLTCHGDITAKGRKCDPNAPNGLDKCDFHGLNMDVSSIVHIENRLSCMTKTSKMGYCCAYPCRKHTDAWGRYYWWCRITDKFW